MDPLHGTSRPLRGIAVALVGLISLAALGGCAVSGAYPASVTVVPVAPAGSVGPTSLHVASNPTTNVFYVTNKNADTVSVFDGVTNKLTATIAVGTEPTRLAVNAVTNKIYVINSGDNSLSVVDGVTNLVTATVASVGPNAWDIAVNPTTNKVYITDMVAQSIYTTNYDLTIVNGATNSVVTRLQVGSMGAGLAINTKTNTIYVAAINVLAVVDGNSPKDPNDPDSSTDKLLARLPSYDAEGVGVDESTNTVYVANDQDYAPNCNIVVYNFATNETTAPFSLGYCPGHIVVNPVTHMVYMATSAATNGLTVLDGTTNTVAGTMSFAVAPADVTINPVTGLAYLTQGSEVDVINTATKTTTAVPVQ